MKRILTRDEYIPYKADDQTKSRQQKVNDFLELRSKGFSFENISKTLNISKPTLIKWSREFEINLNNLKSLEREYLFEELSISSRSRLEQLAGHYKKVVEEVNKRSLEDLPTKQLFSLLSLLNTEIAKINDEPLRLNLVDRVDPFPLLGNDMVKVGWNA